MTDAADSTLRITKRARTRGIPIGFMLQQPGNCVLYARRLKPGDDLRKSLETWIGELEIEAAALVTCVGSLSAAALRMAGADEIRRLHGPVEIVSLTGTLSINGCHCHAALADSQGRVVGGHLVYGCTIHTTAEIVIAALSDSVFDRQADTGTGFRELVVELRRHDKPAV